MSPISNISFENRARQPRPLDQIQAVLEVSYCDVSRVRTLAVSRSAAPILAPGDQIYLSSGGNGAYRTVLRVEPIADGSVMIFLEPGRAERAQRAERGRTVGPQMMPEE